jgi:hypothetical protein
MSVESTKGRELLLRAFSESSYREAEAALAAWLEEPRAEDVLDLTSLLSDAAARRAGLALELVMLSGLVSQMMAFALAAEVERLRAHLGVTVDSDLRRTWQADMAFDPGRLRQRVAELRAAHV